MQHSAAGCPAAIHHLPPPPPPFRFLDLPPEIRTKTAAHIIISRSPITIHEPKFNRHPTPPNATHAPIPSIPTPSPSPPPEEPDPTIGHTRLALLLTCRVLYRENWITYYSANTFVFSMPTLCQFLAAIPASCRNQVRRVSFRMPYKHRQDGIWALLATMERLEELELWLSPPATARQAEWDGCQWGTRECEQLRVLRLRRDDGDGNDKEEEESVLEKDRKVEAKVNEFLEEREKIRERGRKVAEARRLRTPDSSDESDEDGDS